MILYHGSNCDIGRPDPRKGHAGTDFGRGFYLDYVMRFEGLEMRPAMDVVYRSQLFSKLENPNTGLYREGPVYLYDMLCTERGKKLPIKKIYAANSSATGSHF